MSCSHVPDDVETLDSSSYSIDQAALYETVAYLASDTLKGRKTGSLGNQKAQDFIKSYLSKHNISPFESKSYDHPFEYSCGLSTCSGKNIVGIIPGKDSVKGMIVLSAHYDHIGISGTAIYNGADDNASGVAALLSFLSIIAEQPLQHDVVFLFTDAEEDNLKGAKYFLTHHSTTSKQFLLNINLDMLAGSKKSKSLHYLAFNLIDIMERQDVMAFKARHYKQNIKIKKGFKQAVGNSRYKSNRSWQLASDHGAFYRHKIPFIYYGVGTHEIYHTQYDDFDRINKQLFWHATNIIYDQLRFIDRHIK